MRGQDCFAPERSVEGVHEHDGTDPDRGGSLARRRRHRASRRTRCSGSTSACSAKTSAKPRPMGPFIALTVPAPKSGSLRRPTGSGAGDWLGSGRCARRASCWPGVGRANPCASWIRMTTRQTFPTNPATKRPPPNSSQSLMMCAPVDTQMFFVRIQARVNTMRAVPMTTMH